MSDAAEADHPRRRWYDSTEGALAAEAIRRVCCEVGEAIVAGDTARSVAVLDAWRTRVDLTPLSPKALHSITAALEDARGALRSSGSEDARAYIQAALAMLPPHGVPGETAVSL